MQFQMHFSKWSELWYIFLLFIRLFIQLRRQEPHIAVTKRANIKANNSETPSHANKQYKFDSIYTKGKRTLNAAVHINFKTHMKVTENSTNRKEFFYARIFWWCTRYARELNFDKCDYFEVLFGAEEEMFHGTNKKKKKKTKNQTSRLNNAKTKDKQNWKK